jgi:DNA-binding NarL/FixJ family response regulator
MNENTVPENQGDATKVLVVDDHPLVRAGFRQIIEHEPDLVVCGEAEGVQDALRLIADEEPDIVTADLSLQDGSGLQLVKAVHKRYPDLPILVVSMRDEEIYAERVLRAGARGYVMKVSAPGEMVRALRKVLGGEIHVSDPLASRIMQKLLSRSASPGDSPVDVLSNRELEVFELLGQGLRTGEIANRLHLSVKTIETYREHIKEKLSLKNASELVRHAIKWTHRVDEE